MFCNNCGTKIEDGDMFCSNCGTPVPQAAPVPQPVAPAPQPAPQPAPMPQAAPAPEPVYQQPVAPQPQPQPVYQQPMQPQQRMPAYQPQMAPGMQPQMAPGMQPQMAPGKPPKAPKKKKKKSILPIILLFILLVAAVGGGVLFFFRSQLFAASMKMVYSEGTVAVYDNEGYELEVGDNLKLQDGDSMKTEADSLAYIALDQDRFVTLMQQSSAEFIKKGKKLKLDLTRGRIFFNIDNKLKSGESLDICTSSMIVGIRGTSGYIDTDEHGNEVVYMTSGTVTVSSTDKNAKPVEVSAGEKLTATVNSDGEVEFEVEEYSLSSLPKEAANEILADDILLGQVEEATGWDSGDIEERLASSSDPTGDDYGDFSEYIAWTGEFSLGEEVIQLSFYDEYANENICGDITWRKENIVYQNQIRYLGDGVFRTSMGFGNGDPVEIWITPTKEGDNKGLTVEYPAGSGENYYFTELK
ncbi:MAG: zinc ribbon domain-containing protein [Lachnospiraceae bacterium]|nr:zinc ribbon domain-containing protein [Lachnospiraceae bacterium]